MVIKFPLIKHDSLGNGVVIRKKDDKTLEVGFVSDGIKTLSIDNAFMTTADMGVMDFINDELYEYLFTENDKRKAISYIDPFHIHSLEINYQKITGTVIGTEEYHFQIEAKDSFVYFDCSCPVTYLCKHLYAACVFLKRNYAKDNQSLYLKQNSNNKKIRSLLNDYLYYPFEMTSFRLIFNLYHLIKDQDIVADFLKECQSFYNRNQYHNKIVDSLLYPLTFDSGIKKQMRDIANDNEDEKMSLFIQDIFNYSQTFNYEKSEKNKGHRIRYNLLQAVFAGDFDIFIHLEELNEKDYKTYGYALCELLSSKELSFEEIKQINESPNFIKAQHAIYPIYITYQNIVGRNRLLFVDLMDHPERILEDAPIDFILSKLLNSRLPIAFFSIINRRFDEIKKEDYNIIIESIVYTILINHIRNEEYEDSINHLIDKFPDNKYLKELVNYNAGYSPYWRY